MTNPGRNERLRAWIGGLLVLGACSSSLLPGGPPLYGAGEVRCFEDTDCPDPALFVCNTALGRCEASCSTAAQCTAEVRGSHAIEECSNGLGCQCDVGRCVPALCSTDAQCPSPKVCRDGQCVAPPDPSDVTACALSPDFAVIRSGASARFSAAAWGADGAPIVPASPWTWRALDGAPLQVGAQGGHSAELTASDVSAPVGPMTAVEAAIGGATCTARVLVIPAQVPEGFLAAVATDELTGRPIEGARVVLSSPFSGAALASRATDAQGWVQLALPAGLERATVSLFHTDFDYLTVVGHDLRPAGARLVSLVVRRNPLDRYGGYQGTFLDVPATPNVHTGLAGMSIPGSVADFSLAQLVGPAQPSPVKLGSYVDEPKAPLPAGAYLVVGETRSKDRYSAQGLAGVCWTDQGEPDEAAIAEGRCGTRTAWSFAADVPLNELPFEAFAGGLGNVDFAKAIARSGPVIRRLNSSVVRDLRVDLAPVPLKPDGDPDLTNRSHFAALNHSFAQVPLAFPFVLQSPDLPRYRGTYLDAVVVLGAAAVPGRGVVPLGLGAGVNTDPVNAKTDRQAELAAEGLIPVRMAPAHHGLEGAEYALVSMAVSLKPASDASLAPASSALVHWLPQRLPFDPVGASPVTFASGYLPLPEGARYNFLPVAQGTLPPRTLQLSAGAPSDASLLRAVFTDASHRRWVVHFDPAAPAFVVPKPPGEFPDRTFERGDPSGPRASLMVQVLRLLANPREPASQPLTLGDITTFNSTNAERLLDFTSAFAFVDYGRPSVAWLSPADGATVGRGAELRVKVSRFKVGTAQGDDGFLRISFSDATGGELCPPVDVLSDTSQGRGELSATLPEACAGSAVVLTATLVDLGGKPVQPPVSQRATVDIVQ